MALYTKTGDTGQTTVYGGQRVLKSATRVHANGSVDELNAALGVVLTEEIVEPFRSQILHIQQTLFRVGADLATPYPLQTDGMPPARDPVAGKRVTQAEIQEMEQWIDTEEARVKLLTHFILPGGSRVGAFLHQARAICRRAERWVVALSNEEKINGEALRYLNRLGDFLFALARSVNAEEEIEDSPVDYTHVYGS